MTIEREKLLSKIRALLAKTLDAGCTEEEAMAALAKAQAMQAAHEVTEAELRLTKEEKAILRSEPPGTKDPHQIKWHLLYAVSKYCNCEGWRERRRNGGNIIFCGLPADVQHATWLLDHLAAFVKARIIDFLMESEPSNEDRRTAIRGFVAGCTGRISHNLEELSEQTAAAANSNARALVVIKDRAVQDKLKELGIRIHTSCGGYGQLDHSSYAAGQAAGDRASFGRPVSGRNATLRLK
jgi:Protein of unknown function (DUF2786)